MRLAVAALAGVALACAVVGGATATATAAGGAATSAGREPYAVVLGIAQDGGYPQAGTKESPAWEDAAQRRLVACLALVDPASGERWLVDATPHLPEQLHRLDRLAPVAATPGLAGILLTHAHVGHYAGLLHLGREVIGAQGVPVYAMPKMEAFLRGNGPWELLVRLGNITLRPLAADAPVPLGGRLRVTPLLVPHRDEYSETVAFRIQGPRRSLLWLPDIDKWERWDVQGAPAPSPGANQGAPAPDRAAKQVTRIEDALATVDVAYIDGTFFAEGEVPGRAMAEIPHPFVRETLARLSRLPAAERRKVRFVHLNRTNPLLHGDAAAMAEVKAAGMAVAVEGEREEL